MAQLNEFVNDAGDSVTLPNKPTDRHSPNALARITPKYSRGAAIEAYSLWQMKLRGTREVTQFSSILGGSGGWTGGTYLLFTDGNTDGYIWFTFNGAGADPAPVTKTNLGQIDVITADSSADVTKKLVDFLRRLPNTEGSYTDADQADATNTIEGLKTDATAGTLTGSVITVTVIQQGAAPDTTAWDGTYTDIDGAQDLQYNDE